MNYKKITHGFDLASKVCAVMIAPAIVLSTAATVILFPLTILLSLAAGNLREKFNLILRNPVALVFLFFYSMFLIGTIYSAALWPDILLTLRKYDKFLLAILFIPLFTEERWRNYAINAFIGAILVLIVASYLRAQGWLYHYGAGGAEVFKDSIAFNFLMSFAAYLCLFKIVSTSVMRYRVAWTIFLMLIIYTVLFRSIGRSGYFVFAGLMILFFVQKMQWRGLVVAITGITLLFGAAFTFSPKFNGRMNLAFSEIKNYRQTDKTSVGLRMTFVKNSLDMIKNHPILGTGTGSFAKEYAGIYPATSVLTHNPHNEYLYIAMQFGILGLAILLLFFGAPLWYSQFLLEKEKYIARGVVLGIMLGCLANSWLLDVTQGSFYAYFIALSFAALPIRNLQKNSH